MSTDNTALAAYIDRIARIAALAEALAEFADDHGGVAPDDVTWEHVANVTEVANRLADVAGFIGMEITYLEEQQ